MPYTAPYIDETGMHVPSYEDIRDDLIQQMQVIFGNDIYIDEDSMDYQQISIFARKIYDTNNLAMLVYNNRTPINAVGVGLDNIVVFAGIRRKPATYSTVQLTITGDAGTVIENGVATDGTNDWELPEQVTIPSNGIITIEARCNKAGNIGALQNTITQIKTPTYGWLSVTNNYAADSGTDVESDALLRGRFAQAVRSPSLTVFESMLSELEEIDEVTRVVGYENDTGSNSTGTVPPNTPAGLPPHSVTFVVEGGEDLDVASAIYQKKTPGCYTNGTTEVQLQSEVGNIFTIRFYRPTYVDLNITVSIKKLASYNSQYETDIKNAVANFINNMRIGDTLYASSLWVEAMGVMQSEKTPAFSVLSVSMNDGEITSTTELTQEFYEAFSCEVANVNVTVS